MGQHPDIQYFILVDQDRIPLQGSLTLGRHLDNDVVLAGEDVLDYHLRIEVGPRGPRAIPLGESSLCLNGQDRPDEKVGLAPGDRLQIGQEVLEIDMERLHDPEAEEWRLHGSGGGAVHGLGEVFSVGRADDNSLQLQDDHISRHHARLFQRAGTVFVQDYGSANGTFVNGERVTGACRLFHGDEVRFDKLSYQLVGRGEDLTPVNPYRGEGPGRPLQTSVKDRASRATDTTEIAVVSELPPTLPDVDAGAETGAFLLGVSDPVSGLTFRTGIGRTLIGRSDDCDLIIRDRTVSGRHAELVVRPEGVTVTNLMATNGTRVNGEEIQSVQLHDGDVLRLGQVSLVFKDIPPAAAERPWLKNLQRVLMAASILLALVALVLLI